MEIYSCEVLFWPLSLKFIFANLNSGKQRILLKCDSWALTIKENFNQDKIDQNGQL